MRHVLIVAAALFLMVIIHACKTEAPASGTCITALDCDQAAGYECIDGQCVKTSVGGDTDTKENDVTPDGSSDGVLPDDTTDAEEDGDGIVTESDGLPDIATEADGLPDIQPEGDDTDGVEPDDTDDAPVVDDGTVTETDTPVVDDALPVDDATTPDTDTATSVCDGVTCGGHGNCNVVGGVADCTCYSGYQDNDNDNICLPQCAYSGLDCAANHAYCDDTTGTPHCVCNGGYQDNDLNNTCTANCTTAALTCTGGTCDDTTGTAHCTCTDINYQDNDNNGTCLPTCAKAVTEGLNCGTHGACVDTSGTASCVCNEGYTGTGCANCAIGFHLSGSDCVADQTCPANYCNDPKGTCSTPAGVPVCTCSTGYTGTTCLDCADGYQDADLNGTCLEDCTDTCGQDGGLFKTESHGSCQYSGGNAECVCESGWLDPLIYWPPMVPECCECDHDNPPAEYQTYGCPADCTDDPVVTCTGDCYYDKVSGDKYCVP